MYTDLETTGQHRRLVRAGPTTPDAMNPGETTLLETEAEGNSSHHTSQTSLFDTAVTPSQQEQARGNPPSPLLHAGSHQDSTTHCARALPFILQLIPSAFGE